MQAKFNFCSQCGAKTAVAGSSPPKFCSSCGHSFYSTVTASAPKKQARPKFVVQNDNGDDDNDDSENEDGSSEFAGQFKWSKASLSSVEINKPNRTQIGKLGALSEIDGPRDFEKRKFTKDEVTKDWAKFAGVSRQSMEIGDVSGASE